jgi:hypothetical protein
LRLWSEPDVAAAPVFPGLQIDGALAMVEVIPVDPEQLGPSAGCFKRVLGGLRRPPECLSFDMAKKYRTPRKGRTPVQVQKINRFSLSLPRLTF